LEANCTPVPAGREQRGRASSYVSLGVIGSRPGTFERAGVWSRAEAVGGVPSASRLRAQASGLPVVGDAVGRKSDLV